VPRKKKEERFTVEGQDPLPHAFNHVKGVLERAFNKPLEEILTTYELGEILHEIFQLSTNPRKYRPTLGKPLHLFLQMTPEIIRKGIPTETYYDPYLRDKETGGFYAPGASFLEPLHGWWERYPINNAFRIISEYYKRTGKEELAKKAYALSEHARFVDILLTTPEGQEILPTIQEYSQQINSIEDIFRFITSHPKTKEIVEAISPHTRAPFLTLALSLALHSGIHDSSTLQKVSFTANTLDKLHRTGLLPSIRERSAQIRSIQDIFKFITHPETPLNTSKE